MWGVITGWLPGAARAVDRAQVGIVHTPADMQAESDAAGVPAVVPADTPAAHPAAGPFVDPAAPGDHAPPCTVEGCEICVPAPAAQADAEPFLARVPADRKLPPVDLLESLRTANARLRRERDQAVASEAHMARQLNAARQLRVDLDHAGIEVIVSADPIGTRIMRVRVPARFGREDLLFELPPIWANPLHKVDGNPHGRGRPSGPGAAAAGGGAAVAPLPEAGRGQALAGGPDPDAPVSVGPPGAAGEAADGA